MIAPELVRQMEMRRLTARMPRRRLAEIAGCGTATLHNWSDRGVSPSLHAFVAVVEALGGTVTVQWPDSSR